MDKDMDKETKIKNIAYGFAGGLLIVLVAVISFNIFLSGNNKSMLQKSISFSKSSIPLKKSNIVSFISINEVFNNLNTYLENLEDNKPDVNKFLNEVDSILSNWLKNNENYDNAIKERIINKTKELYKIANKKFQTNKYYLMTEWKSTIDNMGFEFLMKQIWDDDDDLDIMSVIE